MNQSERTMYTTGQIAEHIGAEVIGSADVPIAGVEALDAAGPSQMTFVVSARHAGRLADSRAAAVLVAARLDQGPVQLVVPSVEKALIALQKLFAPVLTPQQGVHESAAVDPTAELAPDVAVGPHATIGPHVRIGEGTVVGPGCHIGENVRIGRGCRLDAGVVVYHGCTLGDACIVQANSTIGSTGFGYYAVNGRPELIPHNGGVILEDGVEIGANCCLDRAKFGNTVIGTGSKLDNFVQIGHNVVLGRCCLLASHVALGGSVRLGNGVIIGGGTSVRDNCVLGDGAMAGGASGVTSDVPAGAQVIGTPAIEMRTGRRSWILQSRLPEMNEELRALRKRVEELESRQGNG